MNSNCKDAWAHLVEADPVLAGPGVLGRDGIVALHTALREVATTHIPELHFPGSLHGN